MEVPMPPPTQPEQRTPLTSPTPARTRRRVLVLLLAVVTSVVVVVPPAGAATRGG
jgi:hypothetical protein